MARRMMLPTVGVWYGGISMIKGADSFCLSTVRFRILAVVRAMSTVMVAMKNMAWLL